MPNEKDEPSEMETAAWKLVAELLESGGILAGLWRSLMEELSDNAYPGEQVDAVLLEMMVGSSLPVLSKAGPADCRRATELIAAIHEQVTRDLRMAEDLAGRRERLS